MKNRKVLLSVDNSRRRVIIVTDGDKIATKSVEVACHNLGLRCISMSGGNPTPLTSGQAVELLLQAPSDPVVIMVDDNGNHGTGQGEQVLERLAQSPQLEVIGVVAVASNTPDTLGIDVDYSVTKDGTLFCGTVNKDGIPKPGMDHHLEGDTVDVLNHLDIPIVIGIGDIGKMEGRDDYHHGAPRTTLALKTILDRNGLIQ